MRLESKPGAWEFVVPTRFLMGGGPLRPPGRDLMPDGAPPPRPANEGPGFGGPGPDFFGGPPTFEGLPLVVVTVPKWPVLLGVLQTFVLLFVAACLLLVALAFSLRILQQRIEHELVLARAKANFTAMVSHELKTPITAIRMYAEMLRDGLVTDPETSKEFVGTIAGEALRLQRLIENLLALGKVESGALRLALAPEPLHELIAEAMTRAQAGYSGPGVIKRFSVQSGTRVRAERDAAIQAIANLIHNGLKYGGNPAEVEVEATAQGDRIVIEVRDRGPGIPPDKHQSIFEPYARLENEETRTSQGTGLGLALVKAYATALGGTIDLHARPGGGSIFRLTLQAATEGDPHEPQAADHRG
jgi:signal transduction histidine kinase